MLEMTSDAQINVGITLHQMLPVIHKDLVF